MQCTILASGSKGNCVLIEGQGGALLIDAGLSAREILRRLAAAGKRAESIQALFVTHEHGDHIAGADVLARKLDIPVCATEGTLRAFAASWSASSQKATTVTCRYGEQCESAGFTVTPFATSHDAAEPCGFTIRGDGLVLGYCTDTGVITDPMTAILGRCDGIVLESNHCPVMLREGPYPESLKRRIRSVKGHLSNTAASECLRRLGQNVHKVVLAHISEINNTPERAAAGARDGLGLLFGETELVVASQHGTSGTRPQIMRL